MAIKNKSKIDYQNKLCYANFSNDGIKLIPKQLKKLLL